MPLTAARPRTQSGPMPLFGLSSPEPFFDNKVRAFWNLQILGWLGWLGLRGVSGFANGQSLTFLVQPIVSAITGFSLTLILAVCYRTLINRRPLVMWGVSLALAGIATALWAFIDAWVAQILNPASETGFTSLLLGAVYIVQALFMVSFAQASGIDGAVAGALFSMAGLLSVVAGPLWGWLSDRWNRGGVLLLSMARQGERTVVRCRIST